MLGLVSNLSIFEFHDADRVRRFAVVIQDELCDPKISGPNYPSHDEALFVRLRDAGGFYVLPPLGCARAFENLPRFSFFLKIASSF